MAETSLTIRFRSPGSIAGQESHLAHGGLFVPCPEPAPEPLAEITVVLVGVDGAVVEGNGRVVQVTPAGIAIAFDDPVPVRTALASWVSATRDAPGDGTNEGPTVEWGRPETVGSSGSAADGAAGTAEEEPDSKALYDQIRAMTQPEKMRLAQHGDRAARLLLMKDTNKVIHTFVIQNPRITLDEVIHIAGFPQTNPEALNLIAKNPDWTQNPRVISALVRNPKTPPTMAVKLVDRLPATEIRRLAKSTNVPRAVSQAAKKKVLAGT